MLIVHAGLPLPPLGLTASNQLPLIREESLEGRYRRTTDSVNLPLPPPPPFQQQHRPTEGVLQQAQQIQHTQTNTMDISSDTAPAVAAPEQPPAPARASPAAAAANSSSPQAAKSVLGSWGPGPGVVTPRSKPPRSSPPKEGYTQRHSYTRLSNSMLQEAAGEHGHASTTASPTASPARKPPLAPPRTTTPPSRDR